MYGNYKCSVNVICVNDVASDGSGGGGNDAAIWTYESLNAGISIGYK